MNLKIQYFFPLLLAITSHAGKEVTEKKQEPDSKNTIPHLIQKMEEGLTISSCQTPMSETLSLNFFSVARFLTTTNIIKAAGLNKRFYQAVSACAIGYRAEGNLRKIKKNIENGKINLFIEPLTSEQDFYYPGMPENLENPLISPTEFPSYYQKMIQEIFGHSHPLGKQAKLGARFTQKYSADLVKAGLIGEIPLLGEITLMQPLALILTHDFYKKISELRRLYDKTTTSDDQSSEGKTQIAHLPPEVQQNPLYYYNEILKLRKTPLILQDLTLLREYDSNLLSQVIRCYIDLSQENIVKTEDFDWILDTIKQHKIQISLKLTLRYLEGKNQHKAFIQHLFETGLISELKLSYVINTYDQFASCKTFLNTIPNLDAVKSFSWSAYIDIPNGDDDLIYRALSRMPKLKRLMCNHKALYLCNMIPISLPKGDPVCPLLEQTRIRFSGFETQNVYIKLLPQTLKRLKFPSSLCTNLDFIKKLLHYFDSLKSIDFTIHSTSAHHFMSDLLKHQKLERIILDLGLSNIREKDDENLRNLKIFYDRLSEMRSLKEIILRPQRAYEKNSLFFPEPEVALLFSAVRNYPSLKKIFLDLTMYLADKKSFYEVYDTLDWRTGDIIKPLKKSFDSLNSIPDLLHHAFHTMSDLPESQSIVIGLIFANGAELCHEKAIFLLNQKLKMHPRSAPWMHRVQFFLESSASQVKRRIFCP